MRHDELFAEFDAWVVELAKRGRSGRLEPNADVYLSEDDQTIVVVVEIAGADPSDLRIVVDDRSLFIVGRRHDRARRRRGSVLMKEIEFGEFMKKIHLPASVDFQNAAASYCDGMLTIRLPLSADAVSPRPRTEIRMTIQRVAAR